MSEQGSPNLIQSATIMVAAGAQDEQAIALVQAMRQAGLRVAFAETVNIAVRASEATACVVVLRPDTWKTQAIATVMRAKPDCLIPVLAETMDLPRGPWTHPAISLADAAEQGEQQLIQALRDYLDTFPQNYRVATQVDVGYAANVCAGLVLREDNNGNGYTFTICSDGSWEIDYLTDTYHTLAQGTVHAQSTYTITAQTNGSAQSLSINNQLLKTVNDSHLTNTDHISLFTGYYQLSQNQSVTFSNFTFTPLP